MRELGDRIAAMDERVKEVDAELHDLMLRVPNLPLPHVPVAPDESGNVVLPQDAPWLSDFLAEVAAFPAGAHDDQLDPMFDAINLVQKLPATKPASFVPLPVKNKW